MAKSINQAQQKNIPLSVFKFCVDYGFALFVIVFLWWLLLLIWVLIKVGSKGPGIFSQTRVGQNEVAFTLYKFRSMASGTRQTGTHNMETSDVTWIGNILRKTKLDELPQAINILKNEVSLVGPRPCLFNQETLINERRQRDVFSAKPGITGLAQVRGVTMEFPVELAELDQAYINTRSIKGELMIMWQTAFKPKS
jgi:lipopolysaccharide/colanic/teichoic acid biosynthesis glycosyltransferase